MKLRKTFPFIFVLLTVVSVTGCYRESRNKEELKENINGALETYDTVSAFDGYNLVNGCGIYDMNGQHLLSYPGQECRYYANGDIVAGIDMNYLSMYHQDLSPLWKTANFGEHGVHHDIYLADDSSVYFLSSEIKKFPIEHGAKATGIRSLWGNKGFASFNDIHPFYINGPVRFDSLRVDLLYHVSPKGIVLSKWSSLEQLAALKKIITATPRSAVYCDSLERLVAEYFHFNSVQPLPHNPFEKEHPEFKAGNLLLSEMYFDMVFIMDPNTFKILWSYFQPEQNGHGQHTARMQPNGIITMFVNQSTLPDSKRSKYSKVIDLNPLTKKIEWEYVANPPASFYAPYKGNAQRLPNGNTLITVGQWGKYSPVLPESNYAFEVTPKKKVVWKWKPDVEKLDNADLYRVTRVSKKEMEQFIK